MNPTMKPFLPTVSELENMDRDEFESWIYKARTELQKRAEKRDPLYFLKKRISQILDNKNLSEVQKEAMVLNEIERYERFTSQFQ